MAIKAKDVLTVPDGSYTIGDGLILKVRNDGTSRSWIYRYSINGKRKDYAIAPAKKMNLAVAKAEAARLQGLVVSGVDIQAERQKKKAMPAEEEIRLHPFNEFAIEAYDHVRKMRGNLAPGSLNNYRKYFELHCLPAFGDRPIESITTEDMVQALTPIWTTKTTTASNVRGLFEAIFGYAVSRKFITANPAQWRGNLEFFLPSPKAIHRTEHRKAMERFELQEKIKAFFPTENRVIALLLFTILTASRFNEAQGTRWDELDFNKKVWTCPRLKDRKREEPHRVPLSDQAIELLRSIPRGVSPYVFTLKPSDPMRKPITNHRALVVLKEAFKTDATIHGFRSTFRDWCAEEGKSFEAAEIQMQHKIGTAVTRSYFRSDLLEQRRVLMQEWADFLLPRNPQKEEGDA